VGSLETGKAGDALLLDYPSYHFLAYHTGMNCVARVIKNGRLVNAGTAGCPPAQDKEVRLC
jgi:imidazolonepropionase